MQVVMPLVLLLVCCASLRADEVEDLINLAIARRGAIFSTHLEFVYSKHPPGEPAVRFEKEILDMDNASWATRWENNPSDALLVNHDGYYFRYVKSLDGQVKQIEFRNPEPLNKSGAYNGPPLHAGSFSGGVYEQVVKNSKAFQIVGEEVVNGVPTKVLEVPGSKTVVHTRLNISPELGGIVPKVELLREDGTVFIRHQAFGFEEKAPGIWLPKKIQEEISQEKGWFVYSFETAFSQVNQPIPDERFRKVLEPGTHVIETRDGGWRKFVLNETRSSKEAEQLAKEKFGK